MKKLLLLVVLVAGLLMPSSVGAARQPAPECGATITSDIRLTQDLTCPVLPALQVAPGVTVDLGHHTVTVPNSGGCAPIVLCTAAITVNHPFPSPFMAPITIKNGSIRGSGVRGHVIVDRVKFESADSIAYGGSFTHSKFSASRVAVLAGTVIDRNRFTDSSIAADTALFGVNLTITNNRMDGGGISMWSVTIGGLGGEVRGNRIRSAGISMWFEGAVGLTIADNRVARNGGDGIKVTRGGLVTGDGYVTLTGNIATKNGGAGIRVSDGTPPAVIDGGGNIARRNGEPCVGIVCSKNPSPL